LRQTNKRNSYADHDKQENAVENSDLDWWTIVRPVGLTNKNENLSVLYNLNGAENIKNTIRRNAVVHFILDCIERGQFIKQRPGISSA
jgi:hypothetical protein